jgi:hypothetical protein
MAAAGIVVVDAIELVVVVELLLGVVAPIATGIISVDAPSTRASSSVITRREGRGGCSIFGLPTLMSCLQTTHRFLRQN